MRLALCRICEFADRMASTGNPILMGIFNTMNASRLPAALDRSWLAVEIETDPTEAHREWPIEIRLIDEDGRLITQWHGRLQVGEAAPTSSMRTFITIGLPWDNRFVFERPGRYRFDIVAISEAGQEVILGGESLTVSGPVS